MKKSTIYKQLSTLVREEQYFQGQTLSLIASDNYASANVLSLMNSVFNNKCAEEYPGKRTYAGLHKYDQVENIAVELSKALFNASYANVQAYSGSNANLAVMNAFLKPGERFLGMSTNSGGHQSHGHADNLSSHFFSAITYCTESGTHILDYDKVRDIAIKTQPKLIISGASYYPRAIDFKIFDQIAAEVGAKHLSDISHISGLVIAGLHPDPLPYSDAVTTTTHKMLRGPRGALILSQRPVGEIIDFGVFPFTQGSCHMHKIASIAACLDEASQMHYIDYIKRVKVLADFLAETLMKNDVQVLTGGTDTHMVIVKVDDAKQTIRSLEELNILSSPVTIDGCSNYIRFGTCALASRNIGQDACSTIAKVLVDVIQNTTLPGLKMEGYSKSIKDIADKYPVQNKYE
jgi:glycine hydroxymethyltransferase